MSNRPVEELKPVAASLAKILTSDNADEKTVGQLLDKLGYTSIKAKKQEAGYLKEFVPGGDIGIYSPETIDGKTSYNRNIKFKDKWTLFANVQTIPPKGARKRIVLLGESVARGFLLDPGYTPADVLEKLLNSSVPGEESFELIDLAETNLSMEGIKLRYTECMALKPDLVVFLAGNNWRADMEASIVSESGNVQKMAEAVRQHTGIIGLKGIIEELFESLVSEFLSYINELAAVNEVKVIFAIPEFNLLDCRSTPGERFVTRLPQDGTRRWVGVMNKAEEALGNGQVEEAAAAAAEMIAIDPTHPFGYEILADCNIAQGKFAGARHHFEMARDSAIFCRTNSKPRIYRVIRETILAKASQNKITVVDIPRVFEDYLKGELPGRNLFLDYCHFTAEGIQVAMGAVAEKTLPLFFGPEATLKIKPATIQPDPQVSAMAHLFAAIHNAHWGQSYEILFYHCNKSLEYSKDMAKTMIYYCDMMSRRTTNMLCKTFEILVSDFKFDRYIHALRNPRNSKSMELDLVNAMINALKSLGVNLTAYIDEIRSKEHSVARQKINLLKSYYHVTSYDEYHGTKTAFFQARDPSSRFFLLGEKNFPINFSITLRLPYPLSEPAKVTIAVNNVPVSEIEVSDKWSNHTISITGETCVEGVNVVTIHWPLMINNDDGDAMLSARNGSFDASFILDSVYCVFGEIIYFQAEGSSVTNFGQN